MTDDNKIIYYDTDINKPRYPFKYEDDTLWTTQKIMAELFEVNIPAISKHLDNIYTEQELDRDTTVSKKEIVQQEGGRSIKREIDFYNLDAIIAVGYRVNSKNATKFRQWATETLRAFIMATLAESRNFRNMPEEEKRLVIRNELYGHNKSLAEAAKTAGVESPLDYAIFQNEGYKGLYGGLG